MRAWPRILLDVVLGRRCPWCLDRCRDMSRHWWLDHAGDDR